jgi:protein-disulfide isomerase
VTLVEYGDYQCPYCGQAYPIVKALQARLGDRLRFVFRNFPLTQIHPDALHAAAAAESVSALAGPEAYWAMHDLLFEHQRDSTHALETPYLIAYAERAGADAERVARDLEDGTFAERVSEDFASGVRSGVNGTPTFFVNGVRFDGDWTDADAFALVLRRAAEEPAAARS